MTALLLFAITFALVYLLGIQQLNVQFNQRAQAFITSFAIAWLQLVLLKLMPQPTTLIENTGYLLGGSFGILAAMASHAPLTAFFDRWRRLARRQG